MSWLLPQKRKASGSLTTTGLEAEHIKSVLPFRVFFCLVLRCLEAQCPKQMFGPEVLWKEPLSQPFRSCSGELGQAVAAGPNGNTLVMGITTKNT